MNRWFKYICFTFIITVSLFFIGINNTKALGEPDGNGNAKCVYTCSSFVSQGVMTSNMYYKMGMEVFKNTDGVIEYNVFEAKVQKNDMGKSNGTDIEFDESSYNAFFGDSNLLEEKFHSGGTWGCPTNIYIDYNSDTDKVGIYYENKKEGKVSKRDKCTVSDGSVQSGYSSLTEEDTEMKNSWYDAKNNEVDDVDPSQIAEAYKMCYFTEDEDGNVKYYNQYGNELDKETYEKECTGLNEIDCDIITEDLSNFLNHLFWIISIAGILLLVIMTMVEFIKALTGNDDSGLIKGFKHTLIRILAVVILLLLPTILTALLNLVNRYSTFEIGKDGKVTCGIGVNK